MYDLQQWLQFQIEADVESDVPVAEIQAVEDEPQQEEQIEKSDLEHVQVDIVDYELHNLLWEIRY